MAQIAQTRLGPVEFEIAGEGPPLLSFHGSPGGYDGALLSAQFHLPKGFQIIGFSRPGYLGTPLQPNASVAGQADLAAALLDALVIPAANVYGLSGGGPYALAFALRHPGKCLRLILGAAVTQRDPRPTWQLQIECMLFRFLDPIAWIPCRLLPGAKLVRILSVLTPFHSRAEGYKNDIRVFNSLAPFDLGQITCPVLLVHGRNDRVASFKHARESAARIPGCKTLFIEDAGHVDVFFRDSAKQGIAAFLATA